jgi:glycerophosphoryl diester phosphodiesterase
MSCHFLAHRGANLARPENTLPAFDLALSHPAVDGFECDVRITADGIPVLFHDAKTERLCGAPGTIEDRTWIQVRSLRVRGEPIPSLEAALRFAFWLRPEPKPACFNVELKPTSDPDRVLAACAPVLSLFPVHALVVSSFDPRLLARAPAHGIRARLGYLFEDPAALSALPLLQRAAPIDLHPRHTLVNRESLALWSSPNRRFRTWTVDDAPTALALERLGLAAIISNRASELAEELEPMRASAADVHA